MVVLGLMNELGTLPDLVSSVEPTDVNHLVLSDIHSYYDLSIHVHGSPIGQRVQISKDSHYGIRAWQSAIDIDFNTTKEKEATDKFMPDSPVGVIQLFLHLDNRETNVFKFLDS